MVSIVENTDSDWSSRPWQGPVPHRRTARGHRRRHVCAAGTEASRQARWRFTGALDVSALPASDALQKPPLDGITRHRHVAGSLGSVLYHGPRGFGRPGHQDRAARHRRRHASSGSLLSEGGQPISWPSTAARKARRARPEEPVRPREILDSIMAAGDVLVENFRPGVMDRLRIRLGGPSPAVTPGSSMPRFPATATPALFVTNRLTT